MNSIPIIDFSDSNKEISEKVKTALNNVGFMYIVNHGVNGYKVQKAFAESKRFFEQPDDVKRIFLQNPPVTGYVGWVEPGQELHSKLESESHIVQELRECYDYTVHGDGYPASEFRNSLRALMQECHPVLNKLFRILAESLDLDDKDFFVNSVRCLSRNDVSSLTTLRSTYYPPIPDSISEGSTRCEEHADYGLVTLLFQDDNGGLEVKTVDGRWIPVQPINDSIVVNTGELLEYWTGGFFPATRHRVIVPTDEFKKKCCRQSLVYFIQPDDDVNVTPFRPDSFGVMKPSVNSKEHSMERLEATCLRLVNKDIHNIKPSHLQCLPSYIKRSILKYATGYLFQRIGHGFKDDATLKALLDREVMNLELTNSITTDDTLRNIAEECPHLRELIFGGTNCIFSEIAFRDFIPKMQCLTFLSLKGLNNVTDESIIGLSELEALTHLNLKRCISLTDACGRTLRNIKLKRLDMSYTLISDDWICFLENSPLNETLIDLNLSFCKNLSNSKMKMLKWSNLKYVGLFGLSGLEFMDNVGKLKNVQFTIPF